MGKQKKTIEHLLAVQSKIETALDSLREKPSQVKREPEVIDVEALFRPKKPRVSQSMTLQLSKKSLNHQPSVKRIKFNQSLQSLEAVSVSTKKLPAA